MIIDVTQISDKEDSIPTTVEIFPWEIEFVATNLSSMDDDQVHRLSGELLQSYKTAYRKWFPDGEDQLFLNSITGKLKAYKEKIERLGQENFDVVIGGVKAEGKYISGMIVEVGSPRILTKSLIDSIREDIYFFDEDSEVSDIDDIKKEMGNILNRQLRKLHSKLNQNLSGQNIVKVQDLFFDDSRAKNFLLKKGQQWRDSIKKKESETSENLLVDKTLSSLELDGKDYLSVLRRSLVLLTASMSLKSATDRAREIDRQSTEYSFIFWTAKSVGGDNMYQIFKSLRGLGNLIKFPGISKPIVGEKVMKVSSDIYESLETLFEGSIFEKVDDDEFFKHPAAEELYKDPKFRGKDALESTNILIGKIGLGDIDTYKNGFMALLSNPLMYDFLRFLDSPQVAKTINRRQKLLKEI